MDRVLALNWDQALSVRRFEQAPTSFALRAEHAHLIGLTDRQQFWRLPRRLHERDCLGVRRQAVKPRAVERREGREPIESSFLLENLGVELKRKGRGEDAGAAAGMSFR